MSVFKRGEFWWIDFYDANGDRRRKKVSPDKRIATATLRDIQVKITKGEYLGLKEENTSFRQFAAKYWAAVSHTFSAQEQDRARRILDQHLIPAFGGDRLSRITRQQIEHYMAERAGQVQNSTVNKELVRLKHLLNYAVAWGLLKANPAKGGKNGIKLLTVPPAKATYLVPEQVERLFEACGRHSMGLWAIVTLAMNTGMRRGEILTLTWADVDLRAKHVTLVRTKNNESRIVPLNADATRAVEALPRGGDPFTLVFAGWTGAALTMAFHRACRQAGIANFRFHDLRHHAASWLTMKGVNQRTIEAICGWKDPRTARRYQHLNTAALHEAVARLATAYDMRDAQPVAEAQRP
ncbi:MAG: site-specific integrase [candidate division NC10 bacterium]|nr:site-specific integrase [candidate division NC10 bacterium]MDE2321757.1 site-specific integrase [candidate division NC10 bacterium]